MLGHIEGKTFRNRAVPGGSLPGKPHGHWPWVLKIVADAIHVRAKGSMEAWKKDRSFKLSPEEFAQRLDGLCPGWREWAKANLGARSSSYAELLQNRVYKMYYSGTSDRGPAHDPSTRAAESGEHWTRHFAVDSPLGLLHEQVVRGQHSIPNWREYL